MLRSVVIQAMAAVAGNLASFADINLLGLASRQFQYQYA